MTSLVGEKSVPHAQVLNPKQSDGDVLKRLEYQGEVKETGTACTCGVLDVVGVENKRQGDYASSEESKAWFERTLQEYEDLNKVFLLHFVDMSFLQTAHSVKAHISSTPSDQRNELVPTANPRCEQLSWEEFSLQYKTSRIHADGVPACSPAFSLTTYTCGCPAKSSSIRPRSNLDISEIQDATWKEMVETVSQLRETNRALQQTVKELQDRPHHKKRYEGVTTESAKPDGRVHSSDVTNLQEPQLRKRVLETLRSSVHRMESLMIALRDEQEKSRILSMQMQGFLSASKERTPQPTPPGSTSPLQPCARLDCQKTLQPVSPICLCNRDTCHQRPATPSERNRSRSPSPTPVVCTLNIDTIKQKLSNVGKLSTT
ncbi:hypothetical protein R1flu_018078 [Riccia fluitans]|uniref:Uncharacterized protein n=1 Tax=Riccia fluitans TaxID=41844 RepID=A0ABD1ZET0_9MARC